MTTITGKIENSAGQSLHVTIDFESLSTPQFYAGVVEAHTTKRIRSNANNGEFSVPLAAGDYRVTVNTTPRPTQYTIAVPDGDETISIEDLVTSQVAALPSEAPNLVWNGVRAGHLEFDPISDAPLITATLVSYTGGGIINEQYYYSVTYVTQEGETAPSLIRSVNLNTGSTAAKANRIAFQVNPARVTSKRIWRNKDASSGQLYLLAEVAPEVATYDDWESHAVFATRAATTPGSFNTTAGIIYADTGEEVLYFSKTGLRCLASLQCDELITALSGARSVGPSNGFTAINAESGPSIIRSTLGHNGITHQEIGIAHGYAMQFFAVAGAPGHVGTKLDHLQLKGDDGNYYNVAVVIVGGIPTVELSPA